MDATTKKLVALLDSNDLTLRTAAIRVIMEIGLKSKPVIRAIGRCLREPYEELQLAALQALARLGADDVAGMVVPLVLSSGMLREHAMAVIATLGDSVVPQLQALYPQADFHGKRSIITALARIGGKAALRFLLKILPQESFEIQKHLAFSICEALDRMTPAQQAQVYPLVLGLFKSPQAARNPQIRITAIIILGHFRGPNLAGKALKVLRGYTEKKYPPEVRRYALVSINRLVPEVKVTPDLLRYFMKLLCDEDWHNIAQHALNAFQRMEIPARVLPSLVELLRKSPHFSVHIHVLERLQAIDRPEIAEAIIPFLADPRFRVREAAEAALRRIPSAIESLFKVLMTSDDLEVTQRVNSILRDFPQETRQKYVDRAAVRLMTLFERNDPHYRSFLEFIRSVDPEPLRRRIYQKAKSLKAGRSKDKWRRIAAYLQLLWDNHLITAEGRYLFAVALLRQSAKDLSPTSRRADLGLRVLRALIYDDPEGLIRKLARDPDLKPEDYFYLGFHFSEEGPEVRPFGLAMLEHVVKKYPRSQVAASAAHKLELEMRAARSEEKEERPKEAAGEAAAQAEAPRAVLAEATSAAKRAPRPAAAASGGGGAQAGAAPSRGTGAASAAAAAPEGEAAAEKPAEAARKSASGEGEATRPAARRPQPARAESKPARKKATTRRKAPVTRRAAATKAKTAKKTTKKAAKAKASPAKARSKAVSARTNKKAAKKTPQKRGKGAAKKAAKTSKAKTKKAAARKKTTKTAKKKTRTRSGKR